MDKKALVEKLQKEGYKVSLEGNIPMFVLTNGLSLEKIRDLLKKYEYNASFGYRKAGINETGNTSDKEYEEAEVKETAEAVQELETFNEEADSEESYIMTQEQDGQYSFF